MPFISHFYVYVHILRGERKEKKKKSANQQRKFIFTISLLLFVVCRVGSCLLIRFGNIVASIYFLSVLLSLSPSVCIRLKTIFYLNDERVSLAILTSFLSAFFLRFLVRTSEVEQKAMVHDAHTNTQHKMNEENKKR